MTGAEEEKGLLARRVALLEEAERLAGIGSWEWIPKSGELIWSDNSFRLLGFEPGCVVPSPELVLERTHRDDRELQARAVERIAAGARAERFDYRIVLPDGAVRHMRSSIATIDEREGRPRRVFGYIQDVTELMQAEREIAAHIAVSEVLTEWDSMETGAERLLEDLAEALGAMVASFWVPEGEVLALHACWRSTVLDLSEFEAAGRRLRLPRGAGLPGRVWAYAEPISVAGLPEDRTFLRRQIAAAAGIRSAHAFPVMHGEEVLAVVALFYAEESQASGRLIRSLTGIGYEIGQFLGHRRGALLPPRLTRRELEVLQLAGQGYSGPQIAERLVISPSTVKTHFEHIYEKLGVSDRAAAVATAVRDGLIE